MLQRASRYAGERSSEAIGGFCHGQRRDKQGGSAVTSQDRYDAHLQTRRLYHVRSLPSRRQQTEILRIRPLDRSHISRSHQSLPPNIQDIVMGTTTRCRLLLLRIQGASDSWVAGSIPVMHQVGVWPLAHLPPFVSGVFEGCGQAASLENDRGFLVVVARLRVSRGEKRDHARLCRCQAFRGSPRGIR